MRRIANAGQTEGLDPARQIAGLDDDEWRTFCEWQEALYVDRQGAARYMCEGEDLTYDGTATTCVMSGRFGITDDCALTVDEFARCIVARVNARCWAEMELPDCEIAFCPPSP